MPQVQPSLSRLPRFIERSRRKLESVIGGSDRHSCLKCGFLSDVHGNEVSLEDRIIISAEGQAGWFQPEDPFRCAKDLWLWRSGGVEVMIHEATRKRTHCDGFHSWAHGRDAAGHFKLEDEEREFRRQSTLAWRSFLGALIGAAIGAGVLGYFF